MKRIICLLIGVHSLAYCLRGESIEVQLEVTAYTPNGFRRIGRNHHLVPRRDIVTGKIVSQNAQTGRVVDVILAPGFELPPEKRAGILVFWLDDLQLAQDRFPGGLPGPSLVPACIEGEKQK